MDGDSMRDTKHNCKQTDKTKQNNNKMNNNKKWAKKNAII